ncbi:MAG: cysteine--tRNA ligase [Cyclobacteriaceae bacterium]
MKDFHIYNSYKRKKELFKAINSPHVGLYVCGPTVYGDPHLGHARSAITFDILYRYLKHLGYKVRYVRNITDVGHLEDEVSGTGEDKIAKKARIEQLEPMEVAQSYTNSFHKAVDSLNALRPSIEPCATGHIIEQIELVQKSIKNGFAYEKNGSVYFNLEKYSNAKDNSYGTLSGKVLDDLQSGSRDTEGLDEKESSHDFALWKKANDKHIMKWDSPWGDGFPGWHMECTAMSAKYLGIPFDIHGGGMDLQFPHHEAEIAQSVAAFGKEPVNYWMHNNMLTINGKKMSKSLGNFITLDELFSGKHEWLEQAYSPMTIRFFMLQAHYRSTVDFSNEALQASEKGIAKLMKAMSAAAKLGESQEKEISEELNQTVLDALEGFETEMSDDMNTAKALANLFELASVIFQLENKQLPLNALRKDTLQQLKTLFPVFITDVLGLVEENEGDDSNTMGQLIQLLIDQRQAAKDAKDFATSDKIRDDLQAIGVTLKDSKEGTTFEL